MHRYKVTMQLRDDSADELPEVLATSAQAAAFIAATRWVTAELNREASITGMVIALDASKARVVLSEGMVLDFYAELA